MSVPQAKLIVVYASSGRTASLVAKYRPPMPILTLVVPRLKSNSLSWQMQGRSLARQLLCVRGDAFKMTEILAEGSCTQEHIVSGPNKPFLLPFLSLVHSSICFELRRDSSAVHYASILFQLPAAKTVCFLQCIHAMRCRLSFTARSHAQSVYRAVQDCMPLL